MVEISLSQKIRILLFLGISILKSKQNAQDDTYKKKMMKLHDNVSNAKIRSRDLSDWLDGHVAIKLIMRMIIIVKMAIYLKRTMILFGNIAIQLI